MTLLQGFYKVQIYTQYRAITPPTPCPTAIEYHDPGMCSFIKTNYGWTIPDSAYYFRQDQPIKSEHVTSDK